MFGETLTLIPDFLLSPTAPVLRLQLFLYVLVGLLIQRISGGVHYKHLPFHLIYYFYLGQSRGHCTETHDVSDNKTNRPITRHYLPAVGPVNANLSTTFRTISLKAKV